MDYEKIKCAEEELTLPIPRTFRDALELIRSDYFRYTGRRDSFLKMFLGSLYSKPFGFLFWLRFASVKKRLTPPHFLIRHIILRHYFTKYGLQITPETRIGYGLYIGHGFGTIVNPTAIIGNNVNLSQFTTIGSNEGRAAVIGDNTYIGPSVCLVENVHIGTSCTIGAGAVVTRDIPPNSTAVGVPARVISTAEHSYVGNRWPLPN